MEYFQKSEIYIRGKAREMNLIENRNSLWCYTAGLFLELWRSLLIPNGVTNIEDSAPNPKNWWIDQYSRCKDSHKYKIPWRFCQKIYGQ